MSGEDFSNALCMTLMAASDPTASPPGDPSRPFPFLGLPPEIRNVIYGLLLVSDDPITRLCPSQPENGHLEHLDHPVRRPGFCTAVLRLNQQIYHEASTVLYGANRFQFWIGEWYHFFLRKRKNIFNDDKLWCDLEMIAPRNLRQMSNLSISIFIYGLGGPTPMVRRRIMQCLTTICDALKSDHHLRFLHINVEYLWETWGRYMAHPATEFANRSGPLCRYTNEYIEEKVAKRVQPMLRPLVGISNVGAVFIQAPVEAACREFLETLMKEPE